MSFFRKMFEVSMYRRYRPEIVASYCLETSSKIYCFICDEVVSNYKAHHHMEKHARDIFFIPDHDMKEKLVIKKETVSRLEEEEASNLSFFTQLPPELIHMILTHVNLKDIKACENAFGKLIIQNSGIRLTKYKQMESKLCDLNNHIEEQKVNVRNALCIPATNIVANDIFVSVFNVYKPIHMLEVDTEDYLPMNPIHFANEDANPPPRKLFSDKEYKEYLKLKRNLLVNWKKQKNLKKCLKRISVY